MASPAEMIQKYAITPFSLWELRGKQFIILENLPISGSTIREKKEHNEKYNKDTNYFYVSVEEGLFHKDLKMTETEMLTLFVNMPKGIQNLQGAIFAVDKNNKYGISYQGTAMQDVNGNPIGNNANRGQNTPISQGQQPQDQKELFIRQLVDGMKFSAKMGMPMNLETVEKIANNITPGNGKLLVDSAKQGGYITESAGIFVARD